MVLLVGVNDPLARQPAPKLDFLLNQYFATAMPQTRVLVVAPLPSYRKNEAALTQLFRQAGMLGAAVALPPSWL